MVAMRTQFLAGMVFLCLASEASAVTYYVGKSGSNGNSCVTAQSSIAGNRKLSIAAGLACLNAGDKLIVGDGTYVERFLDQVPSGVSDAARTIVQAENNLQAIIRPGAGGSLWGINAARAFITIDGFDLDGTNCRLVANGGCGGFFTSGGALGTHHHISFKNGRIRNTGGDGISTSNTDNFEVLNTIFETVGSQFGGLAHGIYIGDPSGSTYSTRITISGNYFNSCGGYCIHVYNEPQHHREVIVTKNFMKDCGNLGAQSCTVNYADEAIYSYNVAKDGQDGNFLQRAGTNVIYYNNTAYSAPGGGIQIEGGSNITCRNNLLLNNGSGISGSCTVSSNNITSIAVNHIVDADADNFSLVSGSTAINAGMTSIGTVTFGGVTLNVTATGNPSSSPGVGAYEELGAVDCEVGLVAANILDCTVQNNLNPPVLPAASITGFTVRRALGNNVVTAASRQGTNGFRLTLTDNFTNGQACDFSYAQTGNFTDSALIGNGNVANQELFAITNRPCTNNVGAGGGAVVTQSHAAMFAWDGTESSGVQIGATNASNALRAMVFGKYLARFGLKTTVADTPATNYRLYYSKTGGGYAAVPSFTGTEDVGVCDAPALSNSNTTQRITSGGFVAGRVVEVGAGVPTITMTNGQSTELLYPICYGPNLIAGTDNIKFRVYRDDGTALQYDTNATLNVDVVSPGMSTL